MKVCEGYDMICENCDRDYIYGLPFVRVMMVCDQGFTSTGGRGDLPTSPAFLIVSFPPLPKKKKKIFSKVSPQIKQKS